MKTGITLAIAVCAGCLNVAAERIYYVAPDGSDTAVGTLDAPFRSLEKARDTIRALSEVERRQNIRVILHGGTYRMKKPFVLNVRDGAPLGLNVSYEAFPHETPTLDSGVEISGWGLAEELPEGAPEAAEGKLYTADLPPGLGRFHTLFDQEGFLTRARVPYKSAPTMKSSIKGTRTRWKELDLLHFVPGQFHQWHNIRDIEIYLKPTRNWVSNFLALKSVDLEQNIARTQVEGTYKLSGHLRKRRSNYDAIAMSGVRPRFFGYRFRDFPNFPEELPDIHTQFATAAAR